MALLMIHDFFAILAREQSPFWRYFLYVELILIGAILFGLIEGLLYWAIRRSYSAVTSRRELSRRELDTIVRVRR